MNKGHKRMLRQKVKSIVDILKRLEVYKGARKSKGGNSCKSLDNLFGGLFDDPTVLAAKSSCHL